MKGGGGWDEENMLKDVKMVMDQRREQVVRE
jgi:hypothetical protein